MDEMGQGMGEKRNVCRVFVRVREGKDHLRDVGINWRIVLY